MTAKSGEPRPVIFVRTPDGGSRPLRRTRRLSDGCREGKCAECPFGPALCACGCHAGPREPRTWGCPDCAGSGTQAYGSVKERQAGERRTCPRCGGSGRIPEGAARGR